MRLCGIFHSALGLGRKRIMEVTHIILMHDDEILCRKKKCKNKVLITPVDLDGNWSCSKCGKKQKNSRRGAHTDN